VGVDVVVLALLLERGLGVLRNVRAFDLLDGRWLLLVGLEVVKAEVVLGDCLLRQSRHVSLLAVFREL